MSTRERLAQVEALIAANRARLSSMGTATRSQILAYKREAAALAIEAADLRKKISRGR